MIQALDIFPNSISFEKISFYTEILTQKDEFWFSSIVSLMNKHPKTTLFLFKISAYKFGLDSS